MEKPLGNTADSLESAPACKCYPFRALVPRFDWRVVVRDSVGPHSGFWISHLPLLWHPLSGFKYLNRLITAGCVEINPQRSHGSHHATTLIPVLIREITRGSRWSKGSTCISQCVFLMVPRDHRMAAMAMAAGDDEPVLDRSFRGHKGGVSCLAFSPTTRQLASGSADCSVMVWNFKPQLRAFKLEVGPRRPIDACHCQMIRPVVVQLSGESACRRLPLQLIRPVNF